MSVCFFDVNERLVGGLEVLFPGWKGEDERICVYSPHDDDAIIGAGYVMRAALGSGAEVHVIIACDGACGYSTPEEREGIVERRRRETLDCYRTFGIPEKNVMFLSYPDFSAIQYVGRVLDPSHEGHFRTTITELRKRRITRILAPNHYHEHIDHLRRSSWRHTTHLKRGTSILLTGRPPIPLEALRSIRSGQRWIRRTR